MRDALDACRCCFPANAACQCDCCWCNCVLFLLLLAASCNCIADAVDVTLNFFRVGLLRCERPAGLEQSVPVCCDCECLQCAQTHATGAALDHYRYHHYYQFGKAKLGSQIGKAKLGKPIW